MRKKFQNKKDEEAFRTLADTTATAVKKEIYRRLRKVGHKVRATDPYVDGCYISFNVKPYGYPNALNFNQFYDTTRDGKPIVEASFSYPSFRKRTRAADGEFPFDEFVAEIERRIESAKESEIAEQQASDRLDLMRRMLAERGIELDQNLFWPPIFAHGIRAELHSYSSKGDVTFTINVGPEEPERLTKVLDFLRKEFPRVESIDPGNESE